MHSGVDTASGPLIGTSDKSEMEKSSKWTIIQILAGIFVLCLLPYLHIGVFGYLVWPGKAAIDRTSCGCTCFDTVFRGYYESQPGSSYKHWYFNSTFIAYKMWCLVIVGVICAYESTKHIVRCIIQKNISSYNSLGCWYHLADEWYFHAVSKCKSIRRYNMLFLFVLTIFPHYYSWWNYLNYYNEAVYWQWYHQLYFTVSEIISSGFVMHLLRRSTAIQTYHILGVLTINMSHIIIGGLDQFISNILYREGRKAQVVRDFGLVVPDFFAVIVILIEMRRLAAYRKCRVRSLFYKEELLFCATATILMIVVGKQL